MLITILAISLSSALEPRTSSCVPDAISIAPSHQFYFGKNL